MNQSFNGLPDTNEFIASLDNAVASLPGWDGLFDLRRSVLVTRAPGRLDLMGGIADYSGSLVLQWPIQSAVHVAFQRRRDSRLHIASVPERPDQAPRWFEIKLADLLEPDYATL